MSLLTTPVPIVAGQTLKLAPPEGQAGQVAGMCVVNLSNFLLIASVGPTTTYVIPGTITPVPLSGNGQAVSVTAAYAPASGGSGSVGAQWYYNGENVPPVAVPIGEQVVAASSTVTGPVTVQGDPSLPPVNVQVAVDVTAPPSSVVIAPSRVTTVHRAYLPNQTGTIDLVEAPQPSPITVVQQAGGTSSDGSTVQVALPNAPTVGNLLLMMIAAADDGAPTLLPARWTVFGFRYWTGGAWSPVEAGDTATFDLTLYPGGVSFQNFSVMIYEISGASLTNPVTDETDITSAASPYLSQTATISSTTNVNELGFMATIWAPTPAVAAPLSYTGTVGGGASPTTYDGTTQFVGLNASVTQVGFGHGPLCVQQATAVTATMALPAGTPSPSYFYGSLVMINPGPSPISQGQIRVWELDILGSSTDQPYIQRNDSLETLLSTTGAISRLIDLGPSGLLLPAGTGLIATAVDSADFGAVWSLA